MADVSQSPPKDAPTPVPPVDLDGPLRRLKTLAEVQASEATINVFIAEIHPKATKVACETMRSLLPEDHKKINLAHLRRPCTYDQLPEHLQSKLCPPSFLESFTPKSRRKKGGNKPSFILLCATCLVDEQKLLDAIVQALRDPMHVPPSRLHTIPVPLFPPISNEQAVKWSALYWPTSFKNKNPYGPHPATIARAERELTEAKALSADYCMKLARAVAADSKDDALGEPVGVVVVDRTPDLPPRIVAVASDARYHNRNATGMGHSSCGRGNISAHAVMRALGMVAQKRRIIDKKSEPLPKTDPSTAVAPKCEPETNGDKGSSTATASSLADSVSCLALLPPNEPSSDIFLDVPITDREKFYFDPPTLMPSGYLCLELEVYVTHEPCIMCSMALLHSRIGRVVFEKEMRTTGGLLAERQEVESTSKIMEPKFVPQRSLPPTKSAKRRNSRKNSKLRAIQAAIAENKVQHAPSEYGLWWRSQLNWKFLCWQWRQDRISSSALMPTSSSSSGAETAKTDESRSPSIGHAFTSGPATGVENLADIIKSLTLSTIPETVHV